MNLAGTARDDFRQVWAALTLGISKVGGPVFSARCGACRRAGTAIDRPTKNYGEDKLQT